MFIPSMERLNNMSTLEITLMSARYYDLLPDQLKETINKNSRSIINERRKVVYVLRRSAIMLDDLEKKGL